MSSSLPHWYGWIGGFYNSLSPLLLLPRLASRSHSLCPRIETHPPIEEVCHVWKHSLYMVLLSSVCNSVCCLAALGLPCGVRGWGCSDSYRHHHIYGGRFYRA